MDPKDCMHDDVECLVCIHCGTAFDTPDDWRAAQEEAQR